MSSHEHPSALRAPAPDRRLTLPPRPSEILRGDLIGRPEFVILPWLVISLTCFGFAVSSTLRALYDDGPWWLAGGAVLGTLTAAAMAFLSDTRTGRRLRRDVRAYLAGAAGTLTCVAVDSGFDHGPASVQYAGGALLIATYAGMVFPRRLWPLAAGALLVATAALGIANEDTPPTDVVIVGALLMAAWGTGVLANVAHARTAEIARRVSGYDRGSRALGRRAVLEHVEHALARGDAPDGPIALLLVELGLAGHAPEDHAALVAWAGETFPSALPQDAELGRTGDAEFAVLLPGSSRAKAEAVAHSVRAYLHERVDATVGVATSQTRAVDAADLLRVADAALLTAQREFLGFHTLVAGSVRTQAPTAARPAPAAPALSYTQLRRTGRVPRVSTLGTTYRVMLALSLLVIAAAGALVVGRELLDPGPTVYTPLLEYLGGPWVVLMVVLAYACWRLFEIDVASINEWLLLSSSALLAIGIGAASLARGGLTSPLAAAFFAVVLYYAGTMPPFRSLQNLALMLVGWLAVVVLGPASSLWVVPFHLSLFAGAYILGRIGHRALEQAAESVSTLAATDDLTKLPNAAGFEHLADEAFREAATETGVPFAVIALRVDELRALNERYGHAGADSALRRLGREMRRELPDAYVVARTRAGLFLAAVPVGNEGHVRRLARELEASASALHPVQTGHALCPYDGVTVAALVATAEARAGRPASGVAVRPAA